MPGGELLAAAAAGLSVAGILELKRRIGAEWLATHSLPAPYSGPKDDGSGVGGAAAPASASRYIVREGRVTRGLDMNRRTRCCSVPEARRSEPGSPCIRNPPATSCRTTPHWGVDIAGPTNVPGVHPVYAAKAGRVSYAGYGSYGNNVRIAHADGRQSTLYAHLDSMAVRTGDQVTAGQEIGRMGRTIDPADPRMGVHLHFEVHNSPEPNTAPTSRRLDPLVWLRENSILPAGSAAGPSAAEFAALLPDTDDSGASAQGQTIPSAMADFSMPSPVVGIGVALAVGALLLTLYQFTAPKREYRGY